MSGNNNKKRPLLDERQMIKGIVNETTALISSNNNSNNSRERFDSELSLSRLNDDHSNTNDRNRGISAISSSSTRKSSKNLNHSITTDDDIQHHTEIAGTNNTASRILIRSLSPQPPTDNMLDEHNNLMDINMTVSVQKSVNTANTDLTEDDSQFYETQGGGKIYIDPSYIPRHYDEDDNNLDDLRKTTNNKFQLEMDPSWTPFERYKCDLCFIFISIWMDLFAIIVTWIIFVIKDDLGNETFGTPKNHNTDNDKVTDPYPTGYEILRCLFVPLFVYIVNRILHFVISKSIKYLYLHGEKTLFVTLRSIEECNRHFIDICMVFIFGSYIYIICNYWYSQHHENNEIIQEHNGFDKFINEDIWISSQHIDTKSITYFMLIIFMIIYVFDIYCSLHYGYIYYRFTNYARYNSMRKRNDTNYWKQRNRNKGDKNKNKKKEKNIKPDGSQVTNMNLQNNTMNVQFSSANLKEFDNNNNNNDDISHQNQKKMKNKNTNKNKNKKKKKDLGVMHINKKSVVSAEASEINTEPTVSVMTSTLEDVHNINDFNYKDYNPHIHDDIATLKVNKYKKTKTRKKKKEIINVFEEEKKEKKEEKEEKEEKEIIITTPPPIKIESSLQCIPQNVAEYGLRHYSLFEQNRIYRKSIGDKKDKEDIDFIGKKLSKRKRSRSESDLERTPMLSLRMNSNYGERVIFTRNNSINSDIISPIRPINDNRDNIKIEEWNNNDNDNNNDNGDDIDNDIDNKSSLIMELREKVNFLKATLFAKQSILDQFKLDLNEQTFIISNLSLKLKRIEMEKQEIEKELIDKNDELEEKKLLLQVAEDTQIQITKECNRLSHKLKQFTKLSSKKSNNNNDGAQSGAIIVVNSPSSKRKKKKK